MTHNTGDCKKYDKDGTKKEGFKKKGKYGSMNQNFAQIMKDGFAEMTSALKKDKESKNKSRKYDSDSDSSWSVGSGSTGDLENVESKPKKAKLAS